MTLILSYQEAEFDKTRTLSFSLSALSGCALAVPLRYSACESSREHKSVEPTLTRVEPDNDMVSGGADRYDNWRKFSGRRNRHNWRELPHLT